MPFDGSNFPPSGPPKKVSPSENVLTVLILVMALGLLILPVSGVGLLDLIFYLASR